MISFFGAPGPMEMLIIGLMCLMFLAVPAIVITVVLVANRRRPNVVPCPHCGAAAPPWAEFCPSCGQPIRQPPSTST